MTYFADLAACTYWGPPPGPLLAVGWLDRANTFERGAVDRETFAKLAQLIAKAWQPFAAAGTHRCELCTFSGGPATLRFGDTSVTLGSANVFVPAAECVYVAPSLALHYIDAHGYSPPDVFQRAVAACPPMRSLAYLKAIRDHGIHRLGRIA